MVYRMVPYSLFSDLERPLTRLQGHATIQSWVSQKRYKMQIQLQLNT